MADKKVISEKFGDNYTPEQLLLNALEYAEEFETLVLIGLDKDREVRMGSSTGSSLDKIGLVTIAQAQMVTQARDTE